MSGIKSFWGHHFLSLELAVTILVGVAFFAWCRYLGGAEVIDPVVSQNRAAIYGAITSVFGALLGFSITTFALLLGFSSSPLMADVRSSPVYSTLWEVHKSTVRALSLATLLGLVGLILDRDGHTNRIAMYLVAWVFVLSIARLARAVWMLELVTDILTAPSKKRTALQPPNIRP